MTPFTPPSHPKQLHWTQKKILLLASSFDILQALFYLLTASVHLFHSLPLLLVPSIKLPYIILTNLSSAIILPDHTILKKLSSLHLSDYFFTAQILKFLSILLIPTILHKLSISTALKFYLYWLIKTKVSHSNIMVRTHTSSCNLLEYSKHKFFPFVKAFSALSILLSCILYSQLHPSNYYPYVSWLPGV